jgi:hypothetical protein
MKVCLCLFKLQHLNCEPGDEHVSAICFHLDEAVSHSQIDAVRICLALEIFGLVNTHQDGPSLVQSSFGVALQWVLLPIRLLLAPVLLFFFLLLLLLNIGIGALHIGKRTSGMTTRISFRNRPNIAFLFNVLKIVTRLPL